MEAGLTQLSARHASEAGPRQLVRDVFQADSRESELHLSARAPGNRLACCSIQGARAEVAAATTHDSAQADDGSTGHLASGLQRAYSDAERVSTHGSRRNLLLLARPSGDTGERLQVYVLQPSPEREPAAKLEVSSCLCSSPPQWPRSSRRCSYISLAA